MDVTDALTRLGEPIATRLQLRRLGVTAHELTDAVRLGDLLRVRRGYYARPGTDPMLLHAVRIGGRLGCVAAAHGMGIWAPTTLFAHVAMRHEASRLRSPHDRSQPLTPQNLDGCELHWWPLPAVRTGNVHTVMPAEALTHIARCQPRGLALAAFDSAVHQGLVGPAGLDGVFAALPAKLAYLRPLIDGRCMSGIETLVRLMLLDAGIPFEVQARFRGIGTVDFLVGGCVVVETDGRLGHDDAVSRARDYGRDAALVRLGYSVVRLNYAQVMFDPAGALATIVAALHSHRRGPAS